MLKFGFWKLAAPCLVMAIVALAIPSIAMQGDTTADRVWGPRFQSQYRCPSL